ncbi:hypothetical protein BH23GEM2_BH23GEM2_19280 [soil metagenome]
MPAEHHAGVLRAATRVNIRKIALDRVVNSGDTILRTLLPARRETGVNSPRWSPDGQHIAALGWPADGKPDEKVVYVIPAGGGELRRLSGRPRHDAAAGPVVSDLGLFRDVEPRWPELLRHLFRATRQLSAIDIAR